MKGQHSSNFKVKENKIPTSYLFNWLHLERYVLTDCESLVSATFLNCKGFPHFCYCVCSPSQSSADVMFSVTAENVDCFDSGVICRKSLLINIGRSFIVFDDDTGKPVTNAFNIFSMTSSSIATWFGILPYFDITITHEWHWFDCRIHPALLTGGRGSSSGQQDTSQWFISQKKMSQSSGTVRPLSTSRSALAGR